MKKLLFIAYYFPPTRVVAAVRLHHLYKEFSKYFDSIEVFTTANRRLFAREPSLDIPEATVELLPTWDLRRLISRRSQAGATHVKMTTKEHPLVQWFTRLTDSFPFNLLWGDGGLIYIRQGYRQGKQLIESQGITHLFSSFRPYADHYIAYRLKKRYPQLFWIADFRDLHVDPVLHNTLWPRRQKQWNRRILALADIVVTVSQGLAEHLREFHPRVVVLPNGLPPSTTPARDRLPLTIDRFTIAYTGALFQHRRDPAPLFRALRRLIDQGAITAKTVQICYAGKDGDRWQAIAAQWGMDKVSRNLGLLPREQALALQHHAHINLHLTYSTPELKGNLTGKIYEYFAARRPILCLVQGEADPELDDFFRQLNAGLVVYDGLEQHEILEDFLLRRYTEWKKTGKVAPAIPEEKLAPLRWEMLVKTFTERSGLSKT